MANIDQKTCEGSGLCENTRLQECPHCRAWLCAEHMAEEFSHTQWNCPGVEERDRD